MEKLVLDFTKNYYQHQGSILDRSKIPLVKQFQKIRRKISLESNVGFDDFIKNNVKSGVYYLYSSALMRNVNINSKKFDNIVIRSDVVIPGIGNKNSYNLVFIGDLFIGRDGTVFCVKSVELIDTSILKIGELRYELSPVIILPSYRSSSVTSHFPDFKVVSMLFSKSPVKDLKKVLKILADWDKYLVFKKMYCSYLTKEFFSIQNVQFVSAYRVFPDRTGKKSDLKPYLVDQRLYYEDQVIVRQNIPGSDYFPLVKVSISLTNLDENQISKIKGKLKDLNTLSFSTPKYNEDGFIDRSIKSIDLDEHLAYYQDQDVLTAYYVLDPAKRLSRDMGARFICYNPKKELIMLDRQHKALESLKAGNVANPYLVLYLFEPFNLPAVPRIYSSNDVNWYREKLNDLQKKSILKALSSDSIFLLQGPPGTGKTQVISELTMQLVRQGKTVLITSGTHKAIENAFDRLVRSPEIRAVRLDPSKNNSFRGSTRESNYYIDSIVDNFYGNTLLDYQHRLSILQDPNKFDADIMHSLEEIESDLLSLSSLESQITDESVERSNRFNHVKRIYDSLQNDISTINNDRNFIEGFTFQSDLLKPIDSFTKLFLMELCIDEDCTTRVDSLDSNKLDDLKRKYISILDNNLSSLNDDIRRLSRLYPDVSIHSDTDINSISIQIDSLKDEIEHKMYVLRDKVDIISYDDSLSLHAQFDELSKAISSNKRARLEKFNLMKVESPIYRDLITFIESKRSLMEDRIDYTKGLMEAANVYGISSASCSYIKQSSIDALEKYGIGDIDPGQLGVDVVIVDEVSKSSFIDLIIPLLYGRSIILVGDHHQLPPIYDLNHLSSEQMTEISGGSLSIKDNEFFNHLCTGSFFKTLFDSVPESYKQMLDHQYRSHSSIMAVFNHFYGGSENGLKVGSSYQDSERSHEVHVSLNDKDLISPDRHVYFVNCDSPESFSKDSKSARNVGEAKLIVRILELINSSLVHNSDTGVQVKAPSVGVITTYADQAKLIQNYTRRMAFPGFSHIPDERFSVNTVDKFQGSECDIIIVSMVRNPSGESKSDFLKDYRRINVAFSRARSMLVIVGSKDYLSSALVDLSDVNGESSHAKVPIYKEIIDYIAKSGGYLESGDFFDRGEF